MLDLYGVDDPDSRRLFMDLAREGQRKGWWAGLDDLLPAGVGSYLGLEAEAAALRAFGVLVVPGLLRTAEYGRGVIAARRPGLTAEQVERLMWVQERRQEVLHRSDPMELRLVLDESVLLRSIGPPTVMREQLDRLAEACTEPNVTIQVLPLATPRRPVLAGSFGILSFTEPGDADVACAEGIRGQVLVEQRGAEVAALGLTFDSLSTSAMSTPDSAAHIRRLAGRL
jgi:hypothetical protein